MEDGLGCEECVAASGRALAQVCYGLRGTTLGQLFTQMYPGSACARMHLTFKAAYREASQERVHPKLDDLAAAVENAAVEIPEVEMLVEMDEDPGFTRVDLSGPERRSSVPATRPRAMAAYA